MKTVVTQAPFFTVSECVDCKRIVPEPICPECGAIARIGKYQTQRLLAKTPHRRIYLAKDGDGKDVALRELLFTETPNEKELEAFERWASLLQSLSHPSLPKCFDYFQGDEKCTSRLYLAEEFIRGNPLASSEGHPFEEKDACGVALQILNVFDYLHSHKPPMFHGNVKPANLIRQDGGRLFLVNFAEPRAQPSETSSAPAISGAEENIPLGQSAKSPDEASDLYGLGASVLHLLGKAPPEELLRGTGFFPWLKQMTAREGKANFLSAKAALNNLASEAPELISAAFSGASPSFDSNRKLSSLEIQTAKEAARAKQLAEMSENARARRAEEAADAAHVRRLRMADDRLQWMDFFNLTRTERTPGFRRGIVSFLGCIILPWAYFRMLYLHTTHPNNRLPERILVAFLFALVWAGWAGFVWTRAARLKYLSTKSPFAIKGFGKFVHSIDDSLEAKELCNLKVTTTEIDKNAELAIELFHTRLEKLSSRLDNARRKTYWAREGMKLTGEANLRIAQEILSICVGPLAKFQRETGSVQQIEVEGLRADSAGHKV